jgi:hypothetical protein
MATGRTLSKAELYTLITWPQAAMGRQERYLTCMHTYTTFPFQSPPLAPTLLQQGPHPNPSILPSPTLSCTSCAPMKLME